VNGRIEGTVQQLNGENVTINTGAIITGDLLVPGTPKMKINGSPNYVGTVNGSGSAQPSGYTVTLNSCATLAHVVRRTDPVAMDSVPLPPTATGTRDVSVKTSEIVSGLPSKPASMLGNPDRTRVSRFPPFDQG